MSSEKKNLIVELTFQFALDAIAFSEIIYEKKRYRMADQIFGSCTSIGANVREAQNPRSKAEFISKMKIALQEADEAEYWLLLCSKSSFYPDSAPLLTQLLSIQKVLNKIISTSSQQ